MLMLKKSISLTAQMKSKSVFFFAFVCIQVPCYVFDTDGKKHDLSPLIKVDRGFLVDDGDDTVDFYINICRNLSEYRSKATEMNTNTGQSKCLAVLS